MRNQQIEPINLIFFVAFCLGSLWRSTKARKPSEIYSFKLRGVEEKCLFLILIEEGFLIGGIHYIGEA